MDDDLLITEDELRDIEDWFIQTPYEPPTRQEYEEAEPLFDKLRRQVEARKAETSLP